MYADDTLLYLGDMHQSLIAALEIINTFGRFSGIRINWDKSLLFPLTQEIPPANLPTPLQWVDQFKYLSIFIQINVSKYMKDNVCPPVLQNFLRKRVTWKNLPLTPVGRVNLIKMSFLPKFVYVFRHIPICIPNSLINKLDQTISSFVSKGSVPRVARSTVQLPLSVGGLALPNFKKYYWASCLGVSAVVVYTRSI